MVRTFHLIIHVLYVFRRRLTCHNYSADSKLYMNKDPTHNVIRYGQLLEQLRSDPETLSRLRKEVEVLLNEQLTDHSVRPDAHGISSCTLATQLSILQRERDPMMRKYPNFAEIRMASCFSIVDNIFLSVAHCP